MRFVKAQLSKLLCKVGHHKDEPIASVAGTSDLIRVRCVTCLRERVSNNFVSKTEEERRSRTS